MRVPDNLIRPTLRRVLAVSGREKLFERERDVNPESPLIPTQVQHSPDSPHSGVTPIGSLNQSRDVRLLEHNSLRSVYVWVLVLVFLFGANAALTMYQAFRFHRVGVPESVVLPLLGILILRLARIIYRQISR